MTSPRSAWRSTMRFRTARACCRAMPSRIVSSVPRPDPKAPKPALQKRHGPPILRIGGPFSLTSASDLGDVDHLGLGELLESLVAHFSAHARLLRGCERDVRRQVEVLVDPDRARVDPRRDFIGLVE